MPRWLWLGLAPLVFLLGCGGPPAPAVVKVPELHLEHDLAKGIIRAGMSNRMVLLYFYSEGCSYCDMMNASLADESVRGSLADFVIIGVDIDSDFGETSGVKVVPTLVGVVPNLDGGEPVSSFQGFLTPPQLKAFVEMTHRQGVIWVRLNMPGGVEARNVGQAR